MFKHYVIGFVVIGLFLLAISCGSGPAADSQPTRTGNPEMFSVKVLLDENAPKVSFNARDDYRVIDPITTNVILEAKVPYFMDITADGNGIKLGPKKYNSKHLIFEPAKEEPFAINDNQQYRGSLEIIVNPDGKTMMVINRVALEKYIAGVVASEMPSYWELEALKAQAIAARTYVMFIKNKFGKNRPWDVKATQANQVYKGLRAETMRTNEAVEATSGMVLCTPETGEVFPTYYSAVCAGHTENSENVFGDSYDTLTGVDCPWCRFNTRPSLFYWPDVIFDKQTVNKNILAKYPSLNELGTIEKIESAKESVYAGGLSRIISVKLIGSTDKTAYLRGEDLRLAIDPTGSKIQSTSCTIISLKDEFMFIAGKGFGHGVGMCQYGAREMARQNKTAKEILDFYYPGNRIKLLY